VKTRIVRWGCEGKRKTRRAAAWKRTNITQRTTQSTERQHRSTTGQGGRGNREGQGGNASQGDHRPYRPLLCHAGDITGRCIRAESKPACYARLRGCYKPGSADALCRFFRLCRRLWRRQLPGDAAAAVCPLRCRASRAAITQRTAAVRCYAMSRRR